MARKVVGVGSVGTRCWVILLTGNAADDPLFLQFKEAQPSVLAAVLEDPRRSTTRGRVVVGQRMIQGAPDIFLGWGELGGVQFYVRQLRDMKGGASSTRRTDLETLPDYCHLCGWALALAHAKSGDAGDDRRLSRQERGDRRRGRALRAAYADQTDRDYELLVKAAKSGRIEVAQGRA